MPWYKPNDSVEAARALNHIKSLLGDDIYTIELRCTDGGSNKFYSYSMIKPDEFSARYGRIGNPGKSAGRTFSYNEMLEYVVGRTSREYYIAAIVTRSGKVINNEEELLAFYASKSSNGSSNAESRTLSEVIASCTVQVLPMHQLRMNSILNAIYDSYLGEDDCENMNAKAISVCDEVGVLALPITAVIEYFDKDCTDLKPVKSFQRKLVMAGFELSSLSGDDMHNPVMDWQVNNAEGELLDSAPCFFFFAGSEDGKIRKGSKGCLDLGSHVAIYTF